MQIALQLAHFYGWTLDYIYTLNMKTLDEARNYLIEFRKAEGGGQ